MSEQEDKTRLERAGEVVHEIWQQFGEILHEHGGASSLWEDTGSIDEASQSVQDAWREVTNGRVRNPPAGPRGDTSNRGAPTR